jgi:Holliday junction resolvasome RuvABC endonuclease subunit
MVGTEATFVPVSMECEELRKALAVEKARTEAARATAARLDKQVSELETRLREYQTHIQAVEYMFTRAKLLILRIKIGAKLTHTDNMLLKEAMAGKVLENS